MLSSLLVLAACSDTPPEVTPTPEAAGFRFDIDPGSEQVSVTAVGMGALSTQQAGEARLLEPGAELVSRLQSTNFRPGNVLDIRATFENVTDDESFRQPFTFRPALTPEQGNYLSSSEPEVSDAALGGDGVLSPGETTSVLSFRVEHKGERFSYFVNAYAVVEETEGACGDTGVFNGSVTIRTQADIDALRGCTKIEGSFIVNTDAASLDFSPLNSLRTITQSFIVADDEAVPFFEGSPYAEVNPNLTAISGFDNLESVGSFRIINNPSLVSIPEFPELGGDVFQFAIIDNPELVSVPEFGGLENVGNIFEISGNNALTSLSGFGNLQTVATSDEGVEALRRFPPLVISDNASLTSVSGFESLVTVRGPFFIDQNASLASVSGFGSLNTASGLTISDNPSLVSIPAFGALESVPGNFTGLEIQNNDALVSFSGFENLRNAGFLTISDNAVLTSFPDFGALETAGSVDIRNNDALVSFSGFENLSSIQVSSERGSTVVLRVADNDALVSFSGFGELDSLDAMGNAGSASFIIENNPVLVSVPEFGQLTSVLGTNDSRTAGTFSISNNASLTAISGFGQLSEVGGAVVGDGVVRFSNNAALTAISGFERLQTIGFSPLSDAATFSISGNASLTSVSGFDVLTFQDPVLTQINNNTTFDCSIPPQSLLPFLPVDESTGNLVNCPTE